MKEDLRETKERLLEAIGKKEGVTIFLGAYPSERVPEIHWNTKLEPDPSIFVAVAKSLGAKVFYVNWVVFTEDDLEEACMGEPEERVSVDDDDSSEQEYKERIKEFERYVGTLASVRAGFFFDGMFHVFEQEAEWYEKFGELIAGDEDSEEGFEENRKPALSEEAVAWAEKLAHEPTFGKIKDWRQRAYLLKKLAGKEFDHLPTEAIIEHANTIYEVDVRPQEEMQQIEQIRQMRKQGLSILAIAGKLELPRERVQRLIAKIAD